MSDPDAAADSTLPPDDAFALLGNETRMDILRTLGSADGPLGFSELRDAVGVADSGQFNYHLDKLEGHFLRKSDAGYELRIAGQRVIEAVLSGAVTEAPVLEPTRVDAPCPYCGADIEISYREERLLIRCTDCGGTFPGRESTSSAFGELPYGSITLYYLPPAGLVGRDPESLLRNVLAWTFSESIAMGNHVCPRCSAPVESTVQVCEDHDPDAEICDRCDARFPIVVTSRCGNCGNLVKGTIRIYLISNPRIRAFFESRGIDPIAPEWADMSVLYDREEVVTGTDPFEAQITYAVDGDRLRVTVDEDLEVIGVEEFAAES